MSTGVHCSFCNRDQDAVWRMVAGPGVYICSDCIGMSLQILAEESPGAGVKHFRVVSQRQDGTVERGEHGPLPEAGAPDQVRPRWLSLCQTCGSWNVGGGLAACLECGNPFAV